MRIVEVPANGFSADSMAYGSLFNIPIQLQERYLLFS
jgi:hypothetical protein